MDDDQKKVAEAYIKQLDDAKVFSRSIVTQVVPFHGFYAAESYHQHFLDHNPNYPYIVYNDLPKLAQLKKQYPQMCKR
jgi:peptide-methionine (S)-S-oxide reductase